MRRLSLTQAWRYGRERACSYVIIGLESWPCEAALSSSVCSFPRARGFVIRKSVAVRIVVAVVSDPAKLQW